MDEYDVVVLGCGAAGMTAAIRAQAEGAEVGLFEKSDLVGGTAAWSGGMVWIPNNPHMPALDIADSREEVLEYLDSLSLGSIDDDAVQTFVDTGPEMVRWMEANTPVQFEILRGFPDYHPENPGGKPGGGRSMECPLFPFAELGPWAEKVTKGPQLSGALTIAETPLGRGAPDGISAEELERRRLTDQRGTGQALAGRLLKGCLDRGIEPRTGMRARRLITSEGRVTGVQFDTADGPLEVMARHGVIIATGGFEWDAALVKSFLRGPLDVPASPESNTGDGLRMVMRIGAALTNMREAWWAPTIHIPNADDTFTTWLVNGERTRPHSIIVNGAGKRFANEAVNYNAFGAAFHTLDVTKFTYVNTPAYLVFDEQYWTSYGLALTRNQPAPEWIVRADTLAGLAGELGLPADAFEDTVSHWNKNVANGHDPDFGRGTSAVDKWWGDPKYGTGPEATLGPLDQPPYYAVQVHLGVLGTKGGAETNEHAQVIDIDGDPIPGLFAAGNASGVTSMGGTYGGAGGTLGPALVWGYLAGQYAAQAPPPSPT
ncbi:MAG: oxidoreductase [Pseudonocardiales bacterium]|nr:oxidoreductase [Pseudonocardiales bacterium]